MRNRADPSVSRCYSTHETGLHRACQSQATARHVTAALAIPGVFPCSGFAPPPWHAACTVRCHVHTGTHRASQHGAAGRFEPDGSGAHAALGASLRTPFPRRYRVAPRSTTYPRDARRRRRVTTTTPNVANASHPLPSRGPAPPVRASSLPTRSPRDTMATSGGAAPDSTTTPASLLTPPAPAWTRVVAARSAAAHAARTRAGTRRTAAAARCPRHRPRRPLRQRPLPRRCLRCLARRI